jgi:glyoxylase-like metal-dependent hydrolase (beta-lactamase superfamily II)
MSAKIIQIPVGPMANFAYLVVEPEALEAVVVDPGWDSEKILKLAKNLGVKIAGVWLTHTHFDHVRQLQSIMAAAAVPVWVHPLEKSQLDDVSAEIRDVNDGDTVTVGNVTAQVIHTPGHSPGAVCYVIGDGVITGDTLFVGAIGRTDLPGSDPRAMGESLKRLAQLPEDLVVYSGHNYGDQPTSTIGREKQSNPYMNL